MAKREESTYEVVRYVKIHETSDKIVRPSGLASKYCGSIFITPALTISLKIVY